MQFYEDALEEAVLRWWSETKDQGLYLCRREGGRSRGPRGYWIPAWHINPEYAGVFAIAFIEEIDDRMPRCPVCRGELVDGEAHDHVDDSPEIPDWSLDRPRGDY